MIVRLSPLVDDVRGKVGASVFKGYRGGLCVTSRGMGRHDIYDSGFQTGAVEVGSKGVPAQGGGGGRMGLSAMLGESSRMWGLLPRAVRARWGAFARRFPGGYPAGRFTVRPTAIKFHPKSPSYKGTFTQYQIRFWRATKVALYRDLPRLMRGQMRGALMRFNREFYGALIDAEYRDVAEGGLPWGGIMAPDMYLYFFIQLTRRRGATDSNWGWRGPVACGGNISFPLDIREFLPCGKYALASAGDIRWVAGMADMETGALWESGVMKAVEE